MKFIQSNFVNIILLFGISILLAVTVKFKLENKFIPAELKNSVNNSISSAGYNRGNFAKPDIEIWGLLFGSQMKKINADTHSLQTVEPIYDLSNYELLGTVTGSEKNCRAYILQKNTGKKMSLRIGEKLDDLKIIKIRRFYVELVSKDNKRFILKSAIQNKLDSSKKTEIVSSVSKTVSKRDEIQISEISPVQRQLNLGKREINLTRDEINNLLYNELETILTTTNIIPYFKEGKMSGIRINKIADNSALSKYFGLKLSDIITSVNGKSIDSVEKGMKLWDNMKSENSLIIDIIRNNEAMTFSFNIR